MVDAICLIKQIMEKAYKFKVDLEVMFIVFQPAFDSITMNKLIYALMEIKIAIKLIRPIRMTIIKSATTKIRTGVGETDSITINKGVGVKHRDLLLATLFNLALQYVLRNIEDKQIITYADDIVIITKQSKDLYRGSI